MAQQNHRSNFSLILLVFSSALAALMFWAGLTTAGHTAPVNVWTERSDYSRLPEDDLMRLERFRFFRMTRNEHPLARLERIAHDYVYADGSKGYDDRQMRRRMQADDLSLIETFEDTDGTAAMVVRDERSQRYIIAFRGTDDMVIENIANVGETVQDRPVGFLQYNKHKTIWDRWAKKYGAAGGLTVTGHSRGGGLAGLFTASHAGRISELAMFQSPGQMLEDHKRFRQSATKWPKATLVVAAHDMVQLAGQRHIGEPHVIVGMAEDMGEDLGDYIGGKLGGHKSFILQNPWLQAWNGSLYRNPDDGLLLGQLGYDRYASLRIAASPNALQAQKELDGWLIYTGLKTPGSVADKAFSLPTLLGNARSALEQVKQEILAQNRTTLASRGPGDLRPAPDMFDHLLPPEFHGFEPEFYAILKDLIVGEFALIAAGERRGSDLNLDENTRRFIRDHSVAAYLVGLKAAYEGDWNALRFILAIEPDAEHPTPYQYLNPLRRAVEAHQGTDAMPDYEVRTALVQQYYVLQKVAIELLDEMFRASIKLARADLAKGASKIQELAQDISAYLTSIDVKKSVDQAADNPYPPNPASKAKIKQALNAKNQAQAGALASWAPLVQAYEALLNDLFINAISYETFRAQMGIWQGVSESFWDAMHRYPDSKKVQDAEDQFHATIHAVDASFDAQAQSKLHRLSLLLERYTDADAAALLSDLSDQYAQLQGEVASTLQVAPEWFASDGSALGSGEGFLARHAPNGPSATMDWLSGVSRRGADMADDIHALHQRIGDILDDAAPKVDREQGYVLDVIDLYVFEAQERSNILEYSKQRGLGTYPQADSLRSKAYNSWITPLTQMLERFVALQAQLDVNTRIVQDYHRIADERGREIAFYGAAFQDLTAQETGLVRKYLSLAEKMHPGSSHARRSAPALPTIPPKGSDYVGPLLSFNGLVMCVPQYACEEPWTSDAYLQKIAERMWVWQLPAGDTKNAQSDSKTALGEFWAYVPQHSELARQLAQAVLEVRQKVDLIAPLHEQYLALLVWRQELEAGFKAAKAVKPIVAAALPGDQGYSAFANDRLVPERSQQPGGLPASYALDDETIDAWILLHYDFVFLSGRLTYLDQTFVPKATALIDEIIAEEARIRAEVDWRTSEIRRITQTLTARPDMPTDERVQLLDLANDYVNYALGMEHLVYDYAPFRADYAGQAQKAYDTLTSLTQPPAVNGSVIGTVISAATGAPLAGAQIELRKIVSSDLGPTASIVASAGGTFTIPDLPVGWWEVFVSAPGYQSYHQTLNVVAFAPNQVDVALASIDQSGPATLTVSLLQEPGTEATPVTIRITDAYGQVIAEGRGPHKLEAGSYFVNAFALYLETDPPSQQIRLAPGQVRDIEIRVWREDDEDDDDAPYTPPNDTGVVVPLCAPDRDFALAVYRVIVGRDPGYSELNATLNRLAQGGSRAQIVKDALLSVSLDGAGFITKAVQALYGRNPTASELTNWPRTHRSIIIDDMLATAEHQRASQACAALWRDPTATPPGNGTGAPNDEPNGPQTDDPSDPPYSGGPANGLTVEQAYQNYIAAYNRLTSLMAAGRGDTPESQQAYQAYKAAKDSYEALLGTRKDGPNTGSSGDSGANATANTNDPSGGSTTTSQPNSHQNLNQGGAGSLEIVSDSSWKVTSDAPRSAAWAYADFDDRWWQTAVQDWPNRPAVAQQIANMQDTQASWIWQAGDPEVIYTRKTFELAAVPAQAALRVTADNNYSLYINGVLIGEDKGDTVSVWNTAETYDVALYLRPGRNAIAVLAQDLGGGSGLLVDLRMSGTAILPTSNQPSNSGPSNSGASNSGAPSSGAPNSGSAGQSNISELGQALNALPNGGQAGPVPGAQQGSTGFYTPQRGSRERAAIMDAARVPVAADIGQDLIFSVQRLKTNGLWAYLQATPLQPSGAAIDWLRTPLANAWANDMMSDIAMVLLYQNNGNWQVVAHIVGPTDVYWYGWVEQYGLPESLFFSQ